MRKFVLLVTLAFPLIAAPSKKNIRESALRAISFVYAKVEKLDAMTVSTLIDVNRKFFLRLDNDRLQRLIANAKSNKTPFWRFVNPEYLASALDISVMKGTDRIIANALYCDKYALPWDFYGSVEQMIDGGGFEPTRGMMAIGLLFQRQCTFDRNRAARLLDRARKNLGTILTNEKNTSLSAIEAMLFLSLAGFTSDLRGEWIAKVVALQKADGSFLKDEYSTLLAARLLLEYQNNTSR